MPQFSFNSIVSQPEAIVALLIATAFVIIQLVHQRWCATVAFVVVCALLFAYSNMSVATIMILSVLTASAMSLPLTPLNDSVGAEQFTNSKDADADAAAGDDDDDDDEVAEEEDADDDEADDDDADDDDDDDDDVVGGEDDEDDGAKSTKARESFSSSRSKQSSKKRGSGAPRVNAFETFMKSYKSLSPDQVENMTHDTKELIATQKSLMSTVKSLSPIVVQGKEMLDTFKDYFGNGNANALMMGSK